MKVRLGFALAVIALMAFAPAPVPKKQRHGQSAEITLDSFQGTWQATAMHVTRAKDDPAPNYRSFSHVRIEQDRWTFMNDNEVGSTLFISIDHSKRPAYLNFYNRPDKKVVYGVALIRRHQGKVQVMYRWGGEQGRPVTFESAPAGLWIVTLER